jgi:hypothetical protein
LIAVLARIPALRLTRTPRSWGPILGWSLLAVVSAILARRSGGASGSDHVMRGAFGYVVVPLVAYAIVGAAMGGAGLRGAVRGVVALGALPRRAALATTIVAALASAAALGLLGAVVCAVAHGAADPPLGPDVVASLWVSALGGATYAAYFAAGSAIGNGAMRGVFLAVDWILGSGAGLGAVFTPRGHLTALLGGAQCADLPARVSSLALVVMLVGFTALASALTRRV